MENLKWITPSKDKPIKQWAACYCVKKQHVQKLARGFIQFLKERVLNLRINAKVEVVLWKSNEKLTDQTKRPVWRIKKNYCLWLWISSQIYERNLAKTGEEEQLVTIKNKLTDQIKGGNVKHVRKDEKIKHATFRLLQDLWRKSPEPIKRSKSKRKLIGRPLVQI